MTHLFADYGIGVGLRPTHYHRFKKQKPKCVHWAEVITENFLPWAGYSETNSLHNLTEIRKELPIALHGVGLSLGSVDPLNSTYLKAVKELRDKIQPMWISDHLCWTGVNGQNLHDLLPVPYTREALNFICEKVLTVQDFLGSRLIIENVSSYLEFEMSEMTEWEFLKELVQKTDCGLLLDINNIYVSSVNHGFSAKEYLTHIPPAHVAQIHLAGHSAQNGHLIDTHDEPVSEEVWSLYKYALNRFPHKSTMIERDANIPPWEELEVELLRLHRTRSERSIVKKDPSFPLQRNAPSEGALNV